jgi:hypothetical protein
MTAAIVTLAKYIQKIIRKLHLRKTNEQKKYTLVEYKPARPTGWLQKKILRQNANNYKVREA